MLILYANIIAFSDWVSKLNSNKFFMLFSNALLYALAIRFKMAPALESRISWQSQSFRLFTFCILYGKRQLSVIFCTKWSSVLLGYVNLSGSLYYSQVVQTAERYARAQECVWTRHNSATKSRTVRQELMNKTVASIKKNCGEYSPFL